MYLSENLQQEKCNIILKGSIWLPIPRKFQIDFARPHVNIICLISSLLVWHKGHAALSIIAAANKYSPLVLDAQMAETYALREGLRLAQQLGCSTIIVQSDCLEVVQSIQDGNFSAMASAPILDECDNLWREFTKISTEHCDRESNQVAHELARQGFMSKVSCIWVDEPPNCIIPLFIKRCNNVFRLIKLAGWLFKKKY